MSGQIASSKSLCSSLTPQFSLTSWKTLLEFLILWRRPSCPAPSKHIFHIVHNLTDSFPVGCVNEGVSGGELRNISFQSSSPKHKAWHFLIKELGLDRVAKLTPCKNKLCDRIGPVRFCDANIGRSSWQRRFVNRTVILWYRLFHLLWMYRHQDFWHQSLGTVGISQMAGGGASVKRCRLSPSWNMACTLLWSLFPLPSRWNLQTILNTVHFRTGVSALMFNILKMHCTDNVWWRSDVLSHFWWNISLREFAFQSEVRLYWGLWGL